MCQVAQKKRTGNLIFSHHQISPWIYGLRLSCPYVGTFLAKRNCYSSSEGIDKHSGGVCRGVGPLVPIEVVSCRCS